MFQENQQPAMFRMATPQQKPMKNASKAKRRMIDFMCRVGAQPWSQGSQRPHPGLVDPNDPKRPPAPSKIKDDAGMCTVK